MLNVGSLPFADVFDKKNCTKTFGAFIQVLPVPAAIFILVLHHSGIVVIVDQFQMSFKSQRKGLYCFSHHVHNGFVWCFFFFSLHRQLQHWLFNIQWNEYR